MTAQEFARWQGTQKNGHCNMNNKGPVSMRRGMEMIYFQFHKNNGTRLRSRYRP